MSDQLTDDQLRSLLANTEISRFDKLSLLLYLDNGMPKKTTDLKRLAFGHGLREVSKWNVSDILGKAKGLAISLKDGWVLTAKGKKELLSKNYISTQPVIINEVADLKKHSLTIKNSQTKEFVDESIQCLENNLLRAAVVLSWVGAVSLLYDEVATNHLTNFNAEALRRDNKWKTAKNTDDLSKMKEADFLNVIEGLSIIGKNVKQELEQCLKLRNACGHPNSLKFGLRRVASHIEVLILNVFSKF
jgi:hypothetical protein